MLSVTVIFGACGKECESHIDADENGKCDNCGETVEPDHTHTYDKKTVSADYLVAAATCESAATYYYSCSCGEKGTETFTDGDPLAHTFDQKVVSNDYLKAAATCESAATYYYSCSCGEKGTETFASGDPIDHTYDQEVVSSTYFAAAANCESATKYYHSCSCGATGTTTFTYGTSLSHRDADDNAVCDNCGNPFEDGKDIEEHTHTYNQTKVDNAYLATPATCKNAAEYFHSCSCGAKGTTKFSSGTPLGHRDANDDELCDNCGVSFSDGIEPENCPEHYDVNFDMECDICGKDLYVPDKDDILESPKHEF